MGNGLNNVQELGAQSRGLRAQAAVEYNAKKGDSGGKLINDAAALEQTWDLLSTREELLQARKPEVTLAESRRQREAYLTLAARLPNARVIDGTQPLDLVVASIVRETLCHCEKRQAKRSGRRHSQT